MLDPKDPLNEVLMRTFLGCLLFRLGGEQTFTPEEMHDIQESVAGVQIIMGENDKMILRVRGRETLNKMMEGPAVIL
jgi:hypothetical protein